MPLLKAKRALNSMEVGQMVKVISTDQASKRDFVVFAEQSGHQLVEFVEADGVYTHILRKC
jgi:TusA-related sulfurtransferase